MTTRAVDFGHVLVVIDYRTGRVRCLLPPAVERWPGPIIAAPKQPPSWGGTEHPAATTRPAGGGAAMIPGAGAALAAVFALKHTGPQATALPRLTTAIRTAASMCRRPATLAQAEAAVLAVRRAGWFSPGRTACLEESTAAVLLLSVRGLAVTWCHGVAQDPVRLHAWVQTVDGNLVGEPPSTTAYTPVLTITGGRHHQHR